MNRLRFHLRNWAKGLAVVVLIALVGAGTWIGYRMFSDGNEPVQAAVQRTATVTRGNLEVTVSGTGSIEPANTKTVVAGTSGTIESVLIEVGDTVKEGDVLAVFETVDRTSQIRQKELELQRSLLDLEQMYEQFKTADQDSRDSIMLNIEKQRLSIETAEEELRELRESGQAVEVTAPIGGKITQLNVKAGDAVNANTVLAEIVDYSRLQITVPIDELDIVNVQVGQPATVLVDAFPGETFTGTVTAIADQGSYSNGVAAFDVTIRIEDPGSIKAGMSAEAGIRTASRENVLLLPVDAVQSAGGRYFVMAVGARGNGDSGDGRGPGAGNRPDAGDGTGGRQASGKGSGGNGSDGGPFAGGGTRGGPFADDGIERPNRPTGEQGQGVRRNPASASGATGSGETGADRNRAGRERWSGNVAARSAGPQNADSPDVTRVFVEVGISNEDYIEIVSGLNEGDVVILPTTVPASNNPGGQMQGFGFPGGGFPGGGFPGGGFSGGGGFPGGRGGTGGGPGGGR